MLSWAWKVISLKYQWDKAWRCSAGLGIPQIPRGRWGELAGGGVNQRAVFTQTWAWPGAPWAKKFEAH